MTTWLVDSTAPGGDWSGTISSVTLTLTAFTGNLPVVGNVVTGAGMTAATTITGITAAWNGTTGVYTLSNSTSTGTSGVFGQNGSSANGWINALPTLFTAIGGSLAGDDFNLSSAHSEQTSSAIVYNFPGTYTSPNRVFSCDTTNAPAQASDLATGAAVYTNGTAALTIQGNVYCYGVLFGAGIIGSLVASLNLGGATTSGARQIFDNCTLGIGNTATTSRILVGTATIADPAVIDFLNCTFSFGSTSQGITGNYGVHRMINSSIVGSIFPSTLFMGTTAVWWLVQGCDLSALGSGKTLVAANCPGTVQLLNCKLNASVTVSTTSTLAAVKTDLINCDSSATGYRCERYRPQGTITTETTIVRSGGSPQSWWVHTSSYAHRTMPFECFESIIECTAGVAVTVYCDSITDLKTGAGGDPPALTNADLWIEAQVLDNASFPICNLYTNALSDQLASGTTLTAGPRSGSWTTTGMTNPDPRTQSLTFTPQISGYARVKVKVARANLFTLRVDFKLQA